MVARRITGVILAGGGSRRFGQEKAFALWQGQPFLARVHKAVAAASDAVVVLAPFGATGPPYAGLAPGATILPDRFANAGPVEALRGAIELVRTPTVLVAPCDAPGLTAALCRRLVALSEEGQRPAVATPPTGPLFSLFALPVALLQGRLASARRLEDLLAGREEVSTDLEGLNVNKPPGV